MEIERNLRYTAVCSEILNRRPIDKYVVCTEPDPFFTSHSRRRPLITTTTILDRYLRVHVKMEPTTVNRRNRHMDLYRYARV
jgi:hypothetical protein